MHNRYSKIDMFVANRTDFEILLCLNHGRKPYTQLCNVTRCKTPMQTIHPPSIAFDLALVECTECLFFLFFRFTELKPPSQISHTQTICNPLELPNQHVHSLYSLRARGRSPYSLIPSIALHTLALPPRIAFPARIHLHGPR